MSKPPKSIPDLIANWPTIGHFAEDIGCGYEAARQMRMRNRIAPEHWPSVVRAASRRGVPGVTLEWLADQRAERQPSGEAA